MLAYQLLFNIFIADKEEKVKLLFSKFVEFWEVAWNTEDNKTKQSRKEFSKLHTSQQYEFQ